RRKRYRRSEPRHRVAAALALPRGESSDAGAGRDAAVQRPALRQADRQRRRLRREDDGRKRLGLILPPDFPRDLDVVATDFDRTLVWEDGTLRPRTVQALRAARDAGLHVIVVTGRMVKSVRRFLEPAELGEP